MIHAVPISHNTSKSIAGRFWRRVDRRAPNECWPWLAAKTNNGYGRTNARGRRILAHRLAYELSVGPIPDGLDLDHLCRRRDCVNPLHLEPVTRRENLRRSELTLTGANIRKTVCKNGHDLSQARRYVAPNGAEKRRCLQCDKASKQRVCLKCGVLQTDIRQHLRRKRPCAAA